MERLLRIETLVHGGDGLARDEGRVVFVPLSAPGDLARTRIDQPDARPIRGRLLEVVEAGPARTTPPCPIAGACGGCQWQQVTIEEQRRLKSEHVREALRRIGRISEPPMRELVPSPRTWRYRRRVRAHTTDAGWAFARRTSHDFVDVAACLLLEPEVETLAHAVAESLKRAGALRAVETFTIDAVAGPNGQTRGSVFIQSRKVSAALRRQLEHVVRDVKGLSGVVLAGDTAPTFIGQPLLIDSEHRRLRVRPDLFTQANRLGARLLAEAAAAHIEPGESVLEIFAGSGTLTLYLLGRAGRVVATEGSAASLELLRAALREGLEPAQLISGPAPQVMGGLTKGTDRFDHIVLDPPRTGAREIMADVAALARRAITYVSCDPATFARDAAELVARGWRLVSVTPFDLFPHTFHVELIALFER